MRACVCEVAVAVEDHANHACDRSHGRIRPHRPVKRVPPPPPSPPTHVYNFMMAAPLKAWGQCGCRCVDDPSPPPPPSPSVTFTLSTHFASVCPLPPLPPRASHCTVAASGSDSGAGNDGGGSGAASSGGGSGVASAAGKDPEIVGLLKQGECRCRSQLADRRAPPCAWTSSILC